MEDEHDRLLRLAAFDRARELSRQHDDVVPVDVLREGFTFNGTRVSFGSFYSGIFRPKELHGEAALAVVTAPPKSGRPEPYEDTYDDEQGKFTYHFRDARSPTAQAQLQAEADNRKLLEAHQRGLPIIYFRGIWAGQYTPLAPMFITTVDMKARTVSLEAGLPLADTTPAGLVSNEATRRYATREVAVRLHQQRFRTAVLQAYRTRCTVCSLKAVALLQAAHIVEDNAPGGVATVANGLSLCAIHHLAYDRNLMGIDPDGVVHIHRRLLTEIDGPMLKNGLQHFHGARILRPAREADQPDPDRLALRFERFRATA